MGVRDQRARKLLSVEGSKNSELQRTESPTWHPRRRFERPNPVAVAEDMESVADLAPADGGSHLGPSVVQLLGPGYLDALGLGLLPQGLPPSHIRAHTPGFTPPLPDLGEQAHHDLFQAYLGHPGQSAHAHASLESMLGGHALGGAPASGLPLPGTTIDNPLMSFVIGKAENGPGAGQHASELPSAWAPTGAQGPTERSDRTEGAENR